MVVFSVLVLGWALKIALFDLWNLEASVRARVEMALLATFLVAQTCFLWWVRLFRWRLGQTPSDRRQDL
jgi:hypothetical protein